MSIVMILFAALLLATGVVVVINPETIYGLLRKYRKQLALHVIAVLTRLVLGALMLYLAGDSAYPTAVAVIGGLMIAAAIILAAMGRRNFKKLMTGSLSLVKPLGRISGAFAVGFAVFLFAAFL